MIKSVFNKGLIFTLLILFVIPNVLPNISGNSVFETNNHNVIYSQKINNHDTLVIFFHRIYCFGPIYNLTIDNGTHWFESDNLRKLEVLFLTICDWEISYAHYTGILIGFGSGYKFRGILKPTFICGYFY
jgi:hypothetical protein